MKARFAKEIGTRAWLRIYWGEDCPNNGGTRRKGYHNAQVHLGDTTALHDWKFMGEPPDYAGDPRWPVKCDHCSATVPAGATKQVFRKTIYDTPSGGLEPGCLFWATWFTTHNANGNPISETCVFHETGCNGHHLHAILPNGHEWDIDGRASNCTLPNDRVHRCWVRHGEPPDVTVDKAGRTCSAGGGSIMAGDYHGFLRNGEFISC